MKRSLRSHLSDDLSKKEESTGSSLASPVPATVPQEGSYRAAAALIILVAFGGFTFGWDTGTISGFVNMPDFITRFGSMTSSGNVELTETRTGLIVSIFNIGCAVGGLTLAKLGDRLGRRPGLMITMAVYIVGIVVQIASNKSWVQYFVGRIIAGFAVGSISVLCPMFISETSPKAIRGALVSSFQLMVTAGIFLGYCTCYGTHKYVDSRSWRVPLGLCFAWAILMIIGMVFMPESPRFLASKGRVEAAKRSIAKLNGVPINSEFTNNEYASIAASIENERAAGTASWKELIVGKPKILYRVVVGTALQGLQQLTGINYFFYYGTTIFKSVGLQDSFVTSIILGAVNFASSFVSLYSVDKLGRRKTLLGGSCGMTICLLIYASIGVKALYPHSFGVDPNIGCGDAMIFLACLFIFFFAISWGPCVFVVLSEMFPLRIRSKAMGIAQMCNWLMNFLVAFFTPMITDSIHFAYGYVFMGCNFFALIFVFLCIPETKGLTLEDVDKLYELYTPGVSSLESNRKTRRRIREAEAKDDQDKKDAMAKSAAKSAPRDIEAQ